MEGTQPQGSSLNRQTPAQAPNPHPTSPQRAHGNVSEGLVLSFRTSFFLAFCPVADWTSRVKAEWGLAGHRLPTPSHWQPCSTGHRRLVRPGVKGGWGGRRPLDKNPGPLAVSSLGMLPGAQVTHLAPRNRTPGEVAHSQHWLTITAWS